MPDSSAFEEKHNLVTDLSTEAKDQIAEESRRLWRDTTEQIQELIDQSNEAWDLYLRNTPAPSDVAVEGGNAANLSTSKRKGIRLNDIPRSVDSVHSYQHNTTFPADERFFKGTATNELGRQYLDLYEAWASLNMSRAGVIKAFFNHRKRCLLDSAACLAAPWRVRRGRLVTYEVPEIRIPNPFNGQTITIPLTFKKPKEVKKEDAILWEGTEPESLEFTDWRMDPRQPDVDKAYFLRRWYAPTWQVKEEYDLEEVKAYHEHCQDTDNEREKEEAAGIQWSIGDNEAEGKEKALLMIRYDDFVIDGKVYKNHVSVVLNDTDTIWFGPNCHNHGLKPYVISCYTPVPGSPYGKPMVKDAIPTAHAIDTAITQVIDVYRWAAEPVILKNAHDQALKMQGDFIVAPGMTIPVEQLGNALAQLPINVVNTQALIQAIQILKESIRESTGASPVFSGDDPAGGQVTAFQVAKHVQGGQSRFQAVMAFWNEETLERYLKIDFANNQQFMTLNHFVPGFEDELTPNIVKLMGVDWHITANNALIERNQELANMQAIMTLVPELMKIGIMKLKDEVLEFDQTSFLRRFFIKSGSQDVDELIKVVQSPGESVQAASGDVQPGIPGSPQGMSNGGMPMLGGM